MSASVSRGFTNVYCDWCLSPFFERCVLFVPWSAGSKIMFGILWYDLLFVTKGLILCSKKEILWVESRDLSQTDNSYYGVFFSKVEWWVVELLFLSLNNWGLNFLQNESSQFSQIYLSPEKLSKVFTFQSCKWLFAKLSKFTKMTTIFTQIVVLSENRCHFVNLLSFASSYIFLSLRKIMWLNSQDFHLRTQNEEPRFFQFSWIIFVVHFLRIVNFKCQVPSPS